MQEYNYIYMRDIAHTMYDEQFLCHVTKFRQAWTLIWTQRELGGHHQPPPKCQSSGEKRKTHNTKTTGTNL